MRIVGLDLSLTSTGMSDGVSCEVVQTSVGTGPIEFRLDHIVRSVCVYSAMADLAVIEGPAFSRVGPGHEELAALRYMIRVGLWRRHVPFAMVPPSTLKRYVTGHGNATKQLMVATLDARHRRNLSRVKVKDGRYDMADAFGLAAMGYDAQREPLAEWDPASKPDRSALDAVAWPDLLSDD